MTPESKKIALDTLRDELADAEETLRTAQCRAKRFDPQKPWLNSGQTLIQIIDETKALCVNLGEAIRELEAVNVIPIERGLLKTREVYFDRTFSEPNAAGLRTVYERVPKAFRPMMFRFWPVIEKPSDMVAPRWPEDKGSTAALWIKCEIAGIPQLVVPEVPCFEYDKSWAQQRAEKQLQPTFRTMDACTPIEIAVKGRVQKVRIYGVELEPFSDSFFREYKRDSLD